jgi:hypothetical protein
MIDKDLEAELAKEIENLPDEVIIYKTDKGTIVANDKRRIFRIYGELSEGSRTFHLIAHSSKFDPLPDDYDPETFDNTIKPGQKAYLEYDRRLEYVEVPNMCPSFTIQSITTMTCESFESAIREFEEQKKQYDEMVAPINDEHETLVQRITRKYAELISNMEKERDDAIEGLNIKKEGQIKNLAKKKPSIDDYI